MPASPERLVSSEAATAADVPRRRSDFRRPLVCILGLPFDAITLADAVARVRNAAFARRRYVVSTPNLNFAVAASVDTEFRGSVLRSDLSLVDGMPLVWIARFLGAPVPMRVAGSDLFEALAAHPPPAVTVYFFGGPLGAAASACERVNSSAAGLRCVGFESPGMESIEALSSADRIDRINRSGAQFVVVALGAQKGQAWIERNVDRLTAPVISHLGAVVNFAAGSLRRAPRWMRRSGLEWLWRIKEEPALCRRYWNDGRMAAKLLATRVVPEWFAGLPAGRGSSPTIAFVAPDQGSNTVLRLQGSWRDEKSLLNLADAFASAAASATGVVVDLSQVTEVGPRFAALLLVADGWFRSRGGFDLLCPSPAVAASLQRQGVALG